MIFINNSLLENYFSNLKEINNLCLFYNYNYKEENYIVKKWNKKGIDKNLLKQKVKSEGDFSNWFNVISVIETENKYYLLMKKYDFVPLFEFIDNTILTENDNLTIFFNIIYNIKNLQDSFINVDIDYNKIYINQNFEIKILLDNYEENKLNDLFEIEEQLDCTVEMIPDDLKENTIMVGLIFYYLFHKINIFENKNERKIDLLLKNKNYSINDNLNKDYCKILKSLLHYRSFKRPSISKLLTKKLFINQKPIAPKSKNIDKNLLISVISDKYFNDSNRKRNISESTNDFNWEDL